MFLCHLSNNELLNLLSEIFSTQCVSNALKKKYETDNFKQFLVLSNRTRGSSYNN